jgi:hypothetical protein
MGDLVEAPGGVVEVDLAVAAAPWVPVDEVRLLVNGRLARRWGKLADDELVRLARSETLKLPRDAFITLEAGAPLNVDRERWIRERGGVYASVVAPRFVSQAVSNPIFVDVDGDGAFAAPGLRDAVSADTERRLLWTSLGVLLLAVAWWLLRRRAGLG